MNPTIHDIAKRANVSISTVSRVVNNPLAVREEKRQRVLEAIKELGYEPNPFASGLRDRLTKTIVAIIPDIANPFYASMFRGIEDTAREQRNNVMICNTDRNEERFFEYMRYFKKKKVDGIIFASDPLKEHYYKGFEELNIPVVLAATKSEDHLLPYVKIDDYQAGYDAGMFLIRNGHKRIGMISGPKSDPIAGQPRYEGFLASLKKYERLADDSVVFGDFQYDSGYSGMGKLYGKHPDLTAVFAASDEMALGAMAFLQRRNIDVPRQVSVIGFDNIRFSRMITPPLTTISQPIYEIGKEAAMLLYDWIENRDTIPKGKQLQHELIVRDSVSNRNT
ncbi:LacI family DNA-binding transcriptional regulator [Bacillus taeanensis]|nr:LacI family DNA-binding transcriptional regulator [Bacillus taeanensis]